MDYQLARQYIDQTPDRWLARFRSAVQSCLWVAFVAWTLYAKHDSSFPRGLVCGLACFTSGIILLAACILKKIWSVNKAKDTAQFETFLWVRSMPVFMVVEKSFYIVSDLAVVYFLFKLDMPASMWLYILAHLFVSHLYITPYFNSLADAHAKSIIPEDAAMRNTPAPKSIKF
jgi:hypothetical protein